MTASTLDEFVERVRGLRYLDELDAAAVALLDGFRTAGVRCLILKGPALARLLYTREEHRAYSDVDVLVAPADFEDARGVLGGQGYKRADELFGVEDVAGIQHAELWAQRGETRPLWIDVHWRLGGCEAPPEVVWDALAADRASVDLHGRQADVLGRGGLALHLALHAAQHGPEDIKAMADLTRGVQRWSLDVWRSAARLADQVEATPAFAAGLRLLPTGAGIANELGLAATDRLEWEILHREARPRGTFHLQALVQARGIRGRANVLRRALLPTRQWIKFEFPWAYASKRRLLVAYACHIARVPVWAVRAWRFRNRARRLKSAAD